MPGTFDPSRGGAVEPTTTALIALAPLYGLAFGALGVWWDLSRKEKVSPVPTDDQVERFALEQLHKVSADVEGLRIRQSSMLQTVEEQLEEAVGERRAASGMKSRAQKILNEKRAGPLEDRAPGPNGVDLEGMDEEAALAAVAANLGPGPIQGAN